MAEKNEDDDPDVYRDVHGVSFADISPPDDSIIDDLELDLVNRTSRIMYDNEQSASYYESPLRKDENPFSFKKFLNQESSSSSRSKGARRKVFSPSDDTEPVHPRLVNTPEMSSVLPDFVQDHLVVEQCYLSGNGGSSTIDIDSLALHNLPDLNLEHREPTNLPDFTLSAESVSNSKRLPDFAQHTHDQRHNGEERRRGESSLVNGQRIHMSSSPSVPSGLPLYNTPPTNGNCLPFDLPLSAESESARSMASSDSVSKSLPDFLSDGPIRKERLEDGHVSRNASYLVNPSENINGLPLPEVSSPRTEVERLTREVESLNRLLFEKNRRIQILESDISQLHHRDERETSSMECALQQVENNLKLTTKRAVTAETRVNMLKLENKMLKSELSSLRSGQGQPTNNMYHDSTQQNRNHRIAQELRGAASVAETSLRSLLTGIDNLRVIAATVENMHKFQDRTEDFNDFSYQDSASGPAL